ncbi:hypothetical protein [Actinomadura atramentaria]|uniref:hypothetical protein n=1 Tax=Actinomadura atramentaria TaxID=1990 RepID=UPI000377783A|nr:hypothetical protein [Actinomadura atramentaria]
MITNEWKIIIERNGGGWRNRLRYVDETSARDYFERLREQWEDNAKMSGFTWTLIGPRGNVLDRFAND